jgi:hypothetical protein
VRGGTLWQKKLYIRLGKESCGRVRNFGPKNVITTVKGKKVPTLFREKGNIRLGSEKSENISVRLANFFVYS